MKSDRIKTPHMRWLAAGLALLFLVGCGGGGGGSASGGIGGTGSLYGTVSGTIIEAYGDRGEYFRVSSDDNGTPYHPFSMELPSGIGFHLVMITNEGTADEVVTPIGFYDSSGALHARLVMNEGDLVDLGHVTLPLSKTEIPPGADLNGDGVWDVPLILDDYEDLGARNPLMQVDADRDGRFDWDDDDHGDPAHIEDNDSQDHDHDGVPNVYDDDFTPGENDQDHDGINDEEDENPGNHHQ